MTRWNGSTPKIGGEFRVEGVTQGVKTELAALLVDAGDAGGGEIDEDAARRRRVVVAGDRDGSKSTVRTSKLSAEHA